MQYPFFSEDYLAHYGRSKLNGAKVGSGRYRLGSGEDPYQDYGGRKNSGGITSKIAEAKQRHAEKKQAKAEAKEAQKAIDKEEIIKSGNTELVKQHAKELTNAEINAAIERINTLKRLEDIQSGYLVDVEAKVTNIMTHVGTISDWVATADRMMGNVNNLHDKIQKFNKNLEERSNNTDTNSDKKTNSNTKKNGVRF